MKFEWEEINNLGICVTYRAKVIGGWLVNNVSTKLDHGAPILLSESMVFVPDENHSWVIDKE